jgi:hypothetical protein
MFERIYPKDVRTSHGENLRRLGQEMRELAGAIQHLNVTDAYFRNEAADVFAWLMGIANQLHHDHPGGAGGDARERGRGLEHALWQLYQGRATDGRRPGVLRPGPPARQRVQRQR